jgi:hypothetical protein
MPEEPLWPSSKPAYLIETRSIGGTSGAPIYFEPAPAHRHTGREVARVYTLSNMETGEHRRTTVLPYLFVGMILGAHSGPYIGDFISEGESTAALKDADFNSGISIAMRAEDILDFLENDVNLKEKRFEVMKAKQKATGYKPSSAPKRAGGGHVFPSVSDENPQHLEDFTSLLNAAAKTKPQGD